MEEINITEGLINMNDSVSAKETDWVQSCEDAAQNDEFFKTFRSSKAFQRVIEGTPRVGGIWNLKRLLKDKNFLKTLPLLQKSDIIGLPLNTIQFKFNEKSYNLSPTTIRYANNASNCVSFFGKDIFLGNTDIFEIGAGYGGEFKVFNDYSVALFNKKLDTKWHIYDLPSSIAVIKKFLSHFNYLPNFNELKKDSTEKNSNSLVISNGAFSEMTGSLLDEYFEAVISPAKYGYFISNFEIQSEPFGGWNTKKFIMRLKKCGKNDVAILPAEKYLSYFDQQAGSKLIVFGHTALKDDKSKIKDIIIIKFIEFLDSCEDFFKNKFLKN